MTDADLMATILWEYVESGQSPPSKRDLPDDPHDFFTITITGSAAKDPTTGKRSIQFARNSAVEALLREIAQKSAIEGMVPPKPEERGRTGRAVGHKASKKPKRNSRTT
jgi:hypothetical protein